MTAFDVAALLVVLVSALVGFSRGAVKELVTLFAFTLAALAAVFLLPMTGPLAARLVHPPWAGKASAVLVVFVATYVALRVIGAWLTQRLHAAKLGHLDRGAGAVFGVLRAMVLLGAFFLVFTKVTPPDLAPKWIAGGVTWPLARVSARTLAVFAPTGMKFANGVTKVMGDGVAKGFSDDADTDQGVEIGGSRLRPEPPPPPEEIGGPRIVADRPQSPPSDRGLKVHMRDTHGSNGHKTPAHPSTERTR